jgi:pre-mRNA-splicing factor CWC22
VQNMTEVAVQHPSSVKHFEQQPSSIPLQKEREQQNFQKEKENNNLTKRKREDDSDSEVRKSSHRSARRSRSRTPSQESEHKRRRKEKRSKSRGRSRSKSRSRKSSKSRSRSRNRSRSGNEKDNGPEKKDKKQDIAKQVQELTELSRGEKTGGVYIPPFKLAMMQKEIKDKNSKEYQKLTWDALKKSINGLINKVSVANVKNIITELFQENIIRGRGLLCRSLMKSQAASPAFTHVYAALVAVVNTKMPDIGELLLHRLTLQFLKSFRRNQKSVLLATTRFIAHLVNQQVCGVLLALEIIELLLAKPTDDSVEVAVSFVRECGQRLQEITPSGCNRIFDRFRAILHEGEIDKRVQYMIEDVFAVRKTNFKDHPAVIPELDLVDEGDQITHETISLDEADKLDPQEDLNFFKEDPDYQKNEEEYERIRKEILGDSDAESGGEEDEESEDESDHEGGATGENGGSAAPDATNKEGVVIRDHTEMDLTSLKRTIYLTVMSALSFEECAHKLMKMDVKPGQEPTVAKMIVECCAQERTYNRFYGLLGQRFCMLNKTYQDVFDQLFVEQYQTIHRLETNKLRNVAKFFAHLLHSDAISWSVLQHIRLNERDTSSASRIFIKILFQELAEFMGLAKLNARLQDEYMQPYFQGIFPLDNPRDTRFSINFFTSIGLGGLTEKMREHLKNLPKQLLTQPPAPSKGDESSSSSSSDDESASTPSTSSSSSSSSDDESSSSSSSSSSSDDDDDSSSSSATSSQSSSPKRPKKKTK